MSDITPVSLNTPYLDSTYPSSHSADWVGRMYKSPHSLITIVDYSRRAKTHMLLHDPWRECCGKTVPTHRSGPAPEWTYQDLDEEAYTELCKLSGGRRWNQTRFSEIISDVSARLPEPQQVTTSAGDQSGELDTQQTKLPADGQGSQSLNHTGEFRLTISSDDLVPIGDRLYSYDRVPDASKGSGRGQNEVGLGAVSSSGYNDSAFVKGKEPDLSAFSPPRHPRRPSQRPRRNASGSASRPDLSSQGRITKHTNNRGHLRHTSNLGSSARLEHYLGRTGNDTASTLLDEQGALWMGLNPQPGSQPTPQADMAMSGEPLMELSLMDHTIQGERLMPHSRRQSYQSKELAGVMGSHPASEVSSIYKFTGGLDDEITMDTLGTDEADPSTTTPFGNPARGPYGPSHMADMDSTLLNLAAPPFDTFSGNDVAGVGTSLHPPAFNVPGHLPLNQYLPPPQPTQSLTSYAPIYNFENEAASLCAPLHGMTLQPGANVDMFGQLSMGPGSTHGGSAGNR